MKITVSLSLRKIIIEFIHEDKRRTVELSGFCFMKIVFLLLLCHSVSVVLRTAFVSLNQ